MDYLQKIMDDWTANLKCNAKIASLRVAVMECDTFGELHNIISANLEFIVGNFDVLEMFERAIKRIKRIRNESKLSWKIESN